MGFWGRSQLETTQEQNLMKIIQNSAQGSHKISRGSAAPYGTSKTSDGINFALFSEHASKVELYLFLPGEKEAFLTVPLDKKLNRTGWVWHVCISNLPSDVLYGYSIEGELDEKKDLFFDSSKILTDPYAKGLNSPHEWGNVEWWTKENPLLGKIICSHPFNWEGDASPKIPMQDLVIYEMHVRAFTQHPSSKVKNRGTFLGVIEKIPYLKKLGVNAIELLPIFEFNECENHLKNPKNNTRLWNF